MNISNILLIFVVIILLVLTLKNIKANNRKTQVVYVKEANELIKKNYYDYIIDVRDRQEWREDRLISSINIPLKKIYDGVQLYELKSNILLYSNKGQKASVAAAIMRKMGYVNVQYLVGNYKMLK
jgi:rhodanese-related sulfurtransferase|tara:strand:+ start:788 stop:1162 length:375 start_codon:yes stop_codon:yes gene_type:complete